MVAQTPLTRDGDSGDDIIKVENSFQFAPFQEAVLLDDGYEIFGDPHYDMYERVRIKEVIDSFTLRLYEPLIDTWTTDRQSFIQKAIGHDPLYTNRIYYGDREVIPTEAMAVTVEPLSMSNEWIYIQGGISEEYRVSINIYGKDIETDEGMQILNKYADAMYTLFMNNIHLDINSYDTPLLFDANEGDTVVYVADTEDNREYIKLSSDLLGSCTPHIGNPPSSAVYDVQDNSYVDIDMEVIDIQPPTYVAGGIMAVTFNRPLLTKCRCDPAPGKEYRVSEYAFLRRQGIYIYDSRVDNIEYGYVQKGSAFIRAARLNWFGKIVEEFRFPQKSNSVTYIPNLTESSSSSSSSSF